MRKRGRFPAGIGAEQLPRQRKRDRTDHQPHEAERLEAAEAAHPRPSSPRPSKFLLRITDQYFASNLTVEEMRQLARSEEADPLSAFGEACRAELKALRAGMQRQFPTKR